MAKINQYRPLIRMLLACLWEMTSKITWHTKKLKLIKRKKIQHGEKEHIWHFKRQSLKFPEWTVLNLIT